MLIQHFMGGRDNRGNTLLHLAVNNNNYEEVKKLVQEGASINAKNKDGLTPFELANSRNRSEIVAFFVKYKDSTGNTLLHYAAEKGNLELVNLLLEKGAEVNAKNKEDSTPLHLAAYRDLFNIVKELIDNNAGVNERDSNGNTPLHLAAYRGLFSIVKELIDNNANVNEKNSDGNTPLHLAAYEGRFYVVEELVKRGADMEIEAGNGKTPLELARENNASEVVNYLEKKLAEQRGIPEQRKRRHHHGDHPRHHREERSIYLESKGASHSIENVDSAIENNQAASGASKPSSWTNAFAHVVDVVKGVSQFISSPFKPAIDMEDFQPYGVDVVKSLTEKGTDFNSPKGSTESPALLTSGERNNHTVTAVPEISATLVNNILILGILAAGQFNKTQHKQPIHENLLSPREQSMRLNNIDENMIIRAIQQAEEELGDPNTDIDEVKISGNKTGMWKGSN